MASGINKDELTLDLNSLYQQEEYTDTMIGTIKKLTPVKADGSVDSTRDVLFIGQTSIMLPSGPMPIQAPLEAKTLDAAIKLFPDALEAAINDFSEKLMQLAEEQQSRIQTPESNIIIPGR